MAEKKKERKVAGKGFVVKAMDRKDQKAVTKTLVKGAAVGATLSPIGRAASLVGKAGAKIAAKKYSPKAGKEVTKKVTQGSRASVTVKSPKSAGGGVSSPVKGSKVTVTRTKKTRTPKQQAASNEGQKLRRGTREAGRYVGGAIAGSIVTNEVNKRKGR
jgi:hypothetical protein